MSRRRAALRSLADRVMALPRPLAVALVFVAVSLAASGTYSAIRGYNYTMNNPSFCRSCHVMEEAWTRWDESEHRRVACKSCHEASILQSARQVITFVVQRPTQVGTHAVVPRPICAKCHESEDPKWRQVAATAGHQVHARQRGIECVVCHSPGIHRFRTAAQICGNCHVAQTHGERAVKISAMADQHCITCHEFLRPAEDLKTARDVCLDCHRRTPGKSGAWPADAPMQFACSQCHRPHEQRKPIVACTTCHDKPRADIHPPTVVASTPCIACHVPHSWGFGRR